MSQIDELRDRLLSAERQFHSVTQKSRGYRERLMGLMSRIEEEIRSRQEMQTQQAEELLRLMEENDQLRSMLFSLLQAVETRDDTLLDDTLNEMDGRIAGLIGEGQGAYAAALHSEEPAVEGEDDPIAMAPYDAGSEESADDSLVEEAPIAMTAADEPVAKEGVEEAAMAMPASDDAEPLFEPMDDAPAATDDEAEPAMETAATDTVPEIEGATESLSLAADAPIDDGDALNEFLGITPEESNEAESIDYSFATGGWADDAAEEPASDEPAPSIALAGEEDQPAPGDDGSIHDLIDRVKNTQADDGDTGGFDQEADGEDDDENNGTAAAE